MAVARPSELRILLTMTLAVIAAIVAWGFVATTLAHTYPMGLPLDDSYIYLTYAKQFGRGQPFTYFPGGGYSAGSTSALWPMVLAPLWTLGARGHALVWASFLVCALLYGAVALGVYRFTRELVGELCGAAAGLLVLLVAPFAWCTLAGMEVGFAAALAVGALLLLARAERTGPPTRGLGIVLAALALSRPEAMLLVGAICACCAVQRAWHRELRAAAWWLAPLAAPIAWLCANRVFAGHLMPNTGVAKSHFYLPGFDWTYWRETVGMLTGRMLQGLFWDAASPLVWPRAYALCCIVGMVRIALWARRERRYLVGAIAIVAPAALILAVIAASGQWSFQNYRYIAAAFPLLALQAGCALAPPPADWFHPFGRPVRIAWSALAALLVALYAHAALARLPADMRLYAQGAMDTNAQVVTIGEYIHRKLPGARVMFHDAGAIAYYGDGPVYDMLGLVTDHQAAIANNGPGARFEFLERLPPEQRPDYFAYYPSWLGTAEFFGDVLLHTPLGRQIDARRLVGEGDMQVIAATWDHVGTGERPLADHAGWAIVDRVDIADLDSERAHGWVGRMGRRHFGDPTARWSMVEREVGDHGLVIDGGRTIRDGGERFTIHLDPHKPARVVIRTGGQRSYGFHEAITQPVELRLYAGDTQLGAVVLPAPAGQFVELAFALPAPGASELELRTEAKAPYRVFHWFVLQPE
ncbi:MAG TPA: hypothetical protein VLX92_06220 [Kofleriaceae bacterium]|nr:hypothetical protein [Kofleriaceae bacterium]